MFADNFRAYADGVPESVRDAGPRRGSAGPGLEGEPGDG